MDGKIADRKGYEYMRKLTGSSETPDTNQVITLYCNTFSSYDLDKFFLK